MATRPDKYYDVAEGSCAINGNASPDDKSCVT